MTVRPVGIVLTGGSSTRMGVDKATIAIDGKPLAVRVADALWEAGCQSVECQGGDAEAIEAFGLAVMADSQPASGPVVAMLDALHRHEGVPVVVAACDLVDLDGDTVQRLIAAGQAAPEADVVVATTDGRRHLVSWWRAGCAELLEPLVEAGERAYLGALDALDALEVQVSDEAVRNLNTQADADARGRVDEV